MISHYARRRLARLERLATFLLERAAVKGEERGSHARADAAAVQWAARLARRWMERKGDDE